MDWQLAYLRALGAPTTAQNIRFLNTWQRWEGGHTHNTARYNYLNTKLALPGSWDAIGNGVRGYRSLQQGAAAFATTLEKNRGYAGLVQGLRTGDPYKLGSRVATGLQVWVSGQPNGNPGYAHKVLGSNFAAAPEPPDPGAALDAPQLGQPGQPEQPDLSGAVLGNLGSHLRPSEQLSNLVAAVAAAGPSLPSAPAATSTPAPVTVGKSYKGFKVGDPIPAGFQTSVGGRHNTDGLPGFPARDYFARPGAPVVAPVSGTVIRLSGHDPRRGAVEGAGGPLGWSVYIRGTDGHTYYLTHLGSRTVKVGQQLRAGARIGTVANYDKYGRPSHIHMGVK